jgi:hypothetical protein
VSTDPDKAFGLYLPDYPHGEEPLLHLTYTRTYPRAADDEAPEVVFLRGRHRGVALPPGVLPMRNSMLDLQECLREIEEDLRMRDLYPIETSVRHEMTHAPKDPAVQQGWKFVVNVLTVPYRAIQAQRFAWEKQMAAAAKEADKAPSSV